VAVLKDVEDNVALSHKGGHMATTRTEPSYPQVFLGLAGLIVLLWAFSWFLTANYMKPERQSTFGDSFGGVSALFSGLAFAGLVMAILMQREELKLQRKELRLTRKELKRTAAAQEATQTQIQHQAELLATSARLSAANSIVVAYRSMNHTNLGPAVTRLEGIVNEILPAS
jgi:hypothetical protein